MRTSIVKLALFSSLLFQQFNLFAQMSVDTSGTPQSLVQNILTGSDVTVSNITYTGNLLSKGYFNCTACNIGLNEGVILSTGDVRNAVNPASVFTSNNFSGVGDAQLTTFIGGQPTFDAAVLEFDVVPANDKLEIKFQFTSEEYDDYVGSAFADAPRGARPDTRAVARG